MAKKANTIKKVEVEPQIETMEKVATEFFEDTVVSKPKRQDPTYKTINDWEIKDRIYKLKGDKRPLSHTFKSRSLYYFDEAVGYEREIMYSENQNTVFVDEMKGDRVRGRIVFRNGIMHVPKNKVTLQKMLSKYHPLSGKSWVEVSEKKKATDDLEVLNVELDAMLTARSLDVDAAEAIMRIEVGSEVNNMSSKELKRDLLLYAKRNPLLFLELASDDNVILRNFGIKATEEGILKLSNDQRTFSWGSNDRKLMNVPFDEHPYSALAAWFKTDEGMEIYSNIEKRLN
tara:strand:- start:114 stop:974 length:861 start_codon:yes stop_codon:yes gene_type:complete